jgi:hypothetical protein
MLISIHNLGWLQFVTYEIHKNVTLSTLIWHMYLYFSWDQSLQFVYMSSKFKSGKFNYAHWNGCNGISVWQYVCLAPLLYLIRSDLPQDGILICHKIRTLSDIIPFVFSFCGCGWVWTSLVYWCAFIIGTYFLNSYVQFHGCPIFHDGCILFTLFLSSGCTEVSVGPFANQVLWLTGLFRTWSLQKM